MAPQQSAHAQAMTPAPWPASNSGTGTGDKPKAHHEELSEDSKEEIFSPELEALVATDPHFGLTQVEAQKRLEKFGPNEIAEKKTNPILKFIGYFLGPIAYLIEAAVIFAAVIGDWLDFGIILALLLINALIGFVEEAKAESALDALRNTLALKSKVLRDRNLVEVDSKQLVPGDVIVLRIGDIVPADCRLLGLGANGEPSNIELQCDQSALTGESLPVIKKKGAVAYSSSIIKQGQQLCVVAKTGGDTFIGRAANLISITNDAGHFQKVIERIGNFLVVITLVTVSILLIYGCAGPKKNPFMHELEKALVLTIAAIPVGLPTVLSVTMAVGAKQLSAKQVIVKRLAAVEELAAVDILCSDKTGTLTLNQLTLDKPFLQPGFVNEDLLLNAYLASEVGANDPIELAVRTAAEETVPALKNLSKAEGTREIPGYKQTAFVPFDPHSKRTEATVLHLGSTFRVSKGAPQVIIGLCGGNPAASAAVIDLARRGLRALGVARNDGDRWELVGLISLLDPPRPDSAQTILDVAQYGVSTKMITGDQLVIAKEVARRLGMRDNILHADVLVEEGAEQHVAELTQQCEECSGFAQVIPEHKFRVVELLQNAGHVCAMTGDGVNDAPALKKACVGIAVHGCTDAARSAADIVLLAPGLSTIVDGIKTSREIFQRMRSYAVYRITSTIHFLVFFFITLMVWDWSLEPKLIVLICILNDAATLVISVDHAKISKKPDVWNLKQLIAICCVLAAMLVASSFAHFFVARDVFHVDDDVLQAIIYLQVSSCPHFVIFSTRLEGPFWTKLPSWTFFGAIIGTQVFAMFIVMFGVPDLVAGAGYGWALSVMCISFGYCVIMDQVKVLMYKNWHLIEAPKEMAKVELGEAWTEPAGDRDRDREEHPHISIAMPVELGHVKFAMGDLRSSQEGAGGAISIMRRSIDAVRRSVDAAVSEPPPPLHPIDHRLSAHQPRRSTEIQS